MSIYFPSFFITLLLYNSVPLVPPAELNPASQYTAPMWILYILTKRSWKVKETWGASNNSEKVQKFIWGRDINLSYATSGLCLTIHNPSVAVTVLFPLCSRLQRLLYLAHPIHLRLSWSHCGGLLRDVLFCSITGILSHSGDRWWCYWPTCISLI